jgi:predicted nucleotidyltransferase
VAKIPENPEEIFEQISQDYRSVYGTDLEAILLYGSGAKGEYVAGRSDINFLVVLSQKGIHQVDQAIPLIKKWHKNNVATPLFLTSLLEKVKIDKSDLRLQIERELRGKLIYLRQGFLNNGDSREKLENLLSSSVSTFAAIFDSLIYLKKGQLAATKQKVFDEITALFDLDKAVFAQLLNIKKGEWRGSKTQLYDLTRSFINQIAALVIQVDKIS